MREDKIKELDAQYSERLAELNNIAQQAQAALSNLWSQRQMQVDDINAYYDALETAERIAPILQKGEPQIAGAVIE